MFFTPMPMTVFSVFLNATYKRKPCSHLAVGYHTCHGGVLIECLIIQWTVWSHGELITDCNVIVVFSPESLDSPIHTFQLSQSHTCNFFHLYPLLDNPAYAGFPFKSKLWLILTIRVPKNKRSKLSNDFRHMFLFQDLMNKSPIQCSR